MKYTNPVIPGFYPDPSVCRVDEDYYLVNSSFAYFPGVPIWHSKDIVNWRQVGHCLTRESQLQLEGSPISGGIYAPTLRYHKERYYMVTTNVDHGGHFYVWAHDPSGEWSDPIYVEQAGIDPSIFFDDDGKVYFTSTGAVQSKGIYQCEIDIETGQKLSETRLIWTGTGGAFPEGPHHYKVNGYYYLMCAEGGTEYGHMVTIARSDNPYGPYESAPINPILSHRSLHHPIHATGHADLIEAHDGKWWAVFLGIRPVGYPYRHHLGRETFLAPVHWTEDGWPIIGNNGIVDLEMEATGLPLVPWVDDVEVDHFEYQELGLKWSFIRSAKQVDWSLTEKPSYLALRGSNAGLDDPGTPAFIGCRQRHWNCDISTSLQYRPQEGDEAGLAIYMDERHYYTIALTIRNGERVIALCKHIGSMKIVKHSIPVSDAEVELKIKAVAETYQFYYKSLDETWQLLGDAETQFVSTEVAGGFTGVFFGLYNQSLETTAYFDWFRYSIKD
ncbi:glycoside hydrolase family 43 protein [Paenibacillus sp. YIM B09110]|uniref:glycoside hydrolase family 43 protein n=1 Tax=Paenibacillus sp. YIM B09110 TaxID=3126102 RepID=UPI00301DE327